MKEITKKEFTGIFKEEFEELIEASFTTGGSHLKNHYTQHVLNVDE